MLIMETSDIQRQKIIKYLIAQPTEDVVDTAIELWEHLAAQIISIVGEDGFNSLYASSVFLTQSTFPWLPAGSLSPQTHHDHRFAGLKASFEAQTPAQAGAANSQLLITFTDILASLIGEDLTNRMLRSAWGNDAPYKAGKEFKNES